jgi:CRISPR-associated protein Cas1
MSNPSLDQILTWRNLCDAWQRVADNRGAPGPDEVSVRRFARNWEENLRRLQTLVREHRYRPGGLRRVAIPKKDGGQRVLRIANVGDRVLQRAVLNVLDDAFEPRFLPCSFGYRPGRSLHGALAAILKLREQQQTWVLDADIDACFDSLDHGVLRGLLAQTIADEGLLALIDGWLAVGRSARKPDRGIAQGMPISPLLCNIYLHEMDRVLVRARWALVRYADDFIICCARRDEAEQAQQVVAQTLVALKLALHPHKTAITSFDRGFDFLGISFQDDRYWFTWQDKRFEVRGPTPGWLWDYTPSGYE